MEYFSWNELNDSDDIFNKLELFQKKCLNNIFIKIFI